MIFEVEGYIECTECRFAVEEKDVKPPVTINDVMMQHIKEKHATYYNRNLRKTKN